MDYDLWTCTCPWIRFFLKLLLEQVWVFWAALGPAPHQALLPVSSVSANSGPECSCRYSAVCSRPNLSSGLLQTWEQSLEDTRTHSSVTKTVLSLDWRCFQSLIPDFDVSPFVLSRSFLERVGPETPSGVFFTLFFDPGAADFVGLLFISTL